MQHATVSGFGPLNMQPLSNIGANRILLETNSSNSMNVWMNNNYAVGLKNLGNTCFLNSVLQALASIKTFHAYLISQPRLKDMHLVQALKETIAALSLKNRTIEPPVVKVGSVKKRFITMEQQDAHELMQFVISTLTEETEQVSQVPSLSIFKDSSFTFASPLICTSTSLISPLSLALNSSSEQDLSSSIRIPEVKTMTSMEKITSVSKKFLSRNPFVGILQSTLKCSKCGNQFPPTYQKFVDISLSIPEQFLRYNRPEVCTLEDCLRLFSAAELVQDVDCAGCRKKKLIPGLEKLALPRPITVKSSALKKLSIARPPKTLCLHLRRLIGSFGGPVVKLNCHVDFPLELDLAPFCSFNGEVAFESSLVKSIFNVETQERKDSNSRCSSMRLANEASYSSSPVNGSILGGNPSKHDDRFTCECASKKNRVTKGKNGTETSSILYRLVSVIVHHGNHSGGHYTVFRKLLSEPFSNPKEYDEFMSKSMEDPNFQQADKREWVHISDEHTQQVSVEEVLKSQAYMLYYEKVD